MMKYFIAASAAFFSFFGELVVRSLQKARVFISKQSHSRTHEFLNRTISLLIVRVTTMMGMILISVS